MVTQTDIGRVRDWSLLKCLETVATSPIRYRWEFGWSMLIGALAATATVGVAIPAAWIARGGGACRSAVMLLAALSLALPGPAVGLAIIWVLNRPGCPPLLYLYDQTIAAPWLAMSVRGLAPAVLILWHALSTVPQELLDAAAVDGAGPVARLWRIAVPSRLFSILLAWMVVFVLAIGDLGASILVVPPGVSTLSIRIFQLLHYGVEDRVAGICLAQVTILAALAMAGMGIARLRRASLAGRNSRYNDT